MAPSEPSSSARAVYAPDASKLRYASSYFTNARGKRMFHCAVFPAVPVPTRESSLLAPPLRGVVLFLHGIGEHAHRFTHVFEHLCAAGFGVLAYDLAAHGRSESEHGDLRAHSEQFQCFVDDTNHFVRIAKAAVLPALLEPHGQSADTVPLVFMGISFGTLVGLHTVLSGEHAFAAVVLASPAIAVEYTLTLRVLSLLSKPLSWLVPAARLVPGVNFAGLSRDAAFLADYMTDPLNVTENLSVRMGEQTSTAMDALAQDQRVEQPHSAFCALPLLIVQGSADTVTSVPMARQFFARIANRDKQFKEFPGLFHCIFHEPEKQDVLAHISHWLSARLGVGSGAGGAISGSEVVVELPSQETLRSKL